ncbi:MAG TPA: hypothetical protein VJZ49_08500 [Syntrophales bacterium]|nr:hypothetical protein [Syntrophales bacterium]
MEKKEMDPFRRRFLIEIISAGVGLAGLSFFVRLAGAMGFSPIRQGMRKVEGDVRINAKPAREGAAVNIGDEVTTGLKSMAIFLVGEDAFLLRADSKVVIDGKPNPGIIMQVVDLLRLSHGRLLSVFGKGERQIETPTAVAGIRGTGIYVEAEPERSYICTCYGRVDIEARGRPGEKETIETLHHEAPRYIFASGTGPLIAEAPFMNHTDTELMILESYVRRRPPFDPSEGRYDY